MANKKLFNSERAVPKADTVNNAGGRAYSLSTENALAQYAVTGCFNNTFYCNAQTQLDKVLELANAVSPEFLAQVAVYARRHGFMKDMPAFLLAVLSVRSTELLKRVFFDVIDNARMLRNFVQVIRSGVVGRKSLGSAPKKLIQQYLVNKHPERIFKDSVGNDPSIVDIIKMVHPSPNSPMQDATFGYLLGKKFNVEALPKLIREYESFKTGGRLDGTVEVPNVPFQMLTALELTEAHWKQIAINAPWMMTRMNLNTFERHGVLKDKNLVKMIADRLSNEELVRGSKAFPYQLLTAYKSMGNNIPAEIREALQVAMDIALENVPNLNKKVYICVDVSGSMSYHSVTGDRGRGATSKTTCLDAASVFATALYKVNRETEIIPFDTRVHPTDFNPRDSVMTIAQTLARFGGGGTSCSLPLQYLNQNNAKGDLVIYFSDNESWADYNSLYGGTALREQWTTFKRRNKGAKLILADLVPSSHSQAASENDILNIAGFSDQIFTLIDSFANNTGSADYWSKLIKQSVDIK